MPKHPNTVCVSSEPKYPELLFGIMGSLISTGGYGMTGVVIINDVPSFFDIVITVTVIHVFNG